MHGKFEYNISFLPKHQKVHIKNSLKIRQKFPKTYIVHRALPNSWLDVACCMAKLTNFLF